MGLILPQEVEIGLTSSTIKWYEDKGYEIKRIRKNGNTSVPHGSKIRVNVIDLQHGSNVTVKAECECCHKVFDIVYKRYNINRKKSNRTYCKECSLGEIQQENKHETTGIYKWGHKEYALEQLDHFIKDNKTLQGMTVKNKEGVRIRTSLNNNGYNMRELCEELGYDYLELTNQYYEDGYLNNYDNFKFEVNKFIEDYGNFPTLKNFKYDLHIPVSIISKYGNVKDLQKKIMGDQNNLLEDDRGFYNRSHYEYMVAQFLIYNKIDYLREQFPFPNPHSMLRSDFTFYGVNKETYHVEIWGYYESDVASSRSFQYNKKRKEKEELYKKYKINLISINPDVFNCSLEDIQNNLSVIFQPYISMRLLNIDIKHMVNPNKLTDEELLDRFMEYSDDNRFMPKQEVLMKNAPTLFNEMIRRYGNQNKFAKRFNKLTYSKVGLWDEELAIDVFNHIHDKYGYLLKVSEIRDKSLSKTDSMLIGYQNGMQKVFGTVTDGYLFYFDYCIKNNIKLHDNDILYLKNLSIGRHFNRKIATNERMNKAKIIIEKYYDVNFLKEVG